MPYKTFTEQVEEHINFLRSNGLDVEELAIDAGIVRCRSIDQDNGRGEYAYQTKKNKLDNPNLCGLATWCRAPGGSKLTFTTYGLDGECGKVKVKPIEKKPEPIKGEPEEVGSKVRFLWDQSKQTGKSDYLERKRVGAYGIRFAETDKYGYTALVPARDGRGMLWALQFLNADGSKRFLAGSSYKGLFHMLRTPKNGDLIGIAESYVTAASCFELTGLPIVCAFSSDNLKLVALTLNELYPKSRFIMFADNDWHLEAENKPNIGILKAQEAKKIDETRFALVAPDFGDSKPSKEESDWNDLVRVKGFEFAKSQIREKIAKFR